MGAQCKRTGQVLKPQLHRKGYPVVRISYKNKKSSAKIHRMVALAFIPNPMDLPQVNHKDGNKLNNHVDNLEWIDNLSNMRHAVANGLARRVNHAGRPQKAVIAINAVGNISRYNSIADAEENTNTLRSNIVAVCKGRRNKANGYVWKYEKEVI